MTPRQFEVLLRVRRHRRDQVRLLLARVLADARVIDERRRAVDAERAEALAALKSGTSAGGVDVDRAAAFRYHALRLAGELGGLSKAAAANAERAEKARALLTRADQGVKAVERLQERFEALRRLEAQRRADREATDRFSAVRYASTSREQATTAGDP